MEKDTENYQYAVRLFGELMATTKKYFLENPKAANTKVNYSAAVMYLTRMLELNLVSTATNKQETIDFIDDNKKTISEAIDLLKTHSTVKGFTHD